MELLSAPAMPASYTQVILYVDDDIKDLKMMKMYFKKERFNFIEFSSSQEALSYIKDTEKPVGLLISDLRMPKINGIELVKQAKKCRPHLLTVGVTRYPDSEEGDIFKHTTDFWVEKAPGFCQDTAVLVRKALVKSAIDTATRCWYGLKSNNIHVSPELMDNPNFQQFMLEIGELEESHPGEYVAFVNGEFFDHDADREVLLDRVYEHYGESVDVFIQKLAKPRMVHLPSPKKVTA